MINASEFDEFLEQLRNYDGKLWLRISGQTHWQFKEIPFWVLVKNQDQIKEAMPFLQNNLQEIQNDPDADVTVAFISFDGEKKISYGMFKGEEFFDINAIGCLYDPPSILKRKMSVFDYEYPDDEWSMKISS